MVELNDKQKLALYKKSQSSGYSTGILEEVYRRGYSIWDESFTGNAEQFGFDRVNSFIAGGFAKELDSDLLDEKVKPPTGKLKNACWKGYTAVGMKMKNGRKVPNCVPEEYTGAEKISKNKNDPSSRFEGTSSLTDVLAGGTPGQSSVMKTIKKVVNEATYQGKKVPLNKPMKGDVKKSKVYVDPDGDGKAQKVNFGDKNMSIKKDQPGRKASYCARSGGQGNLNDKTSANYWSRKAWDC